MKKSELIGGLSQINSNSTSSSTTLSPEIKILKKHQFIERSSLLDDEDPRSLLNNNSLKGFYNCLYIVCFFYFTTLPILRYYKHGNFIDKILFDSMSRDFLLCLMTWPLFYIWMYVAYLQQCLVIRGFSNFTVSLIRYTCQPLMFIYAVCIVISNDFVLTHSTFVTFHSCVFYLKMHSYTVTNQDLREVWIANGSPKSKNEFDYPNNVNISNFTLWAWMPVIVYETQFPRSEKIRIKYCIKKGIYTLCLMLLDYLVVSEQIAPTLRNYKSMSFIESTSVMVLPCIVVWFTTFHLIWEDYMNFFAEITRFADRQFYQDWWNATSFEEFNRRWNKPVYEFLYRHVYLDALYKYKQPNKTAQFYTVLFSAFLHEFCLAILMRKLTPILLGFMLIQLPVMIYSKGKILKGYENLFVWWGLIQGIPLILNLYLRIDELAERGLDLIF